MKTHPALIAFFAIFISLISLGIAIYSFATLPEIIPIHFGANGKANGWGSKATIFLLPVIGLLLNGFLYSIRNEPFSYLNLPLKISQKNLEERIKLGTRLIDKINLTISILFWAIESQIIKAATNENTNVLWFISPIILLLFGFIIYYTRRINKLA
ncbi:MAG: DUF1648 domain-containing protein [Spirosomaceae bacterium]|jgi:uncharacterized membrane protein|nr:DUF1648 domain-containing protein [Spirosomataceae bacterium]